MTVISLKDANGNEFAMATPERDPRDPLGLLANVAVSLPPGRYTVAWRTAASDGHPSRGTFTFVVLESAGLRAPLTASGTSDTGATVDIAPAQSANAGNEEAANPASSLSNSLARTLSFVGLLVLIGATTFRTLVLPRAVGISSELRERMEKRAALLGLSACVLVILGVFARLFLETEMMSAMPEMRKMSMMDMAIHTQWGLALQLEIGAALLASVSFALAMKRRHGAWLAAVVSVIVLAVTPALAGHAAASPRFTALMIATDFLHVLGGASWLGTLLAVMLVGVPLSLKLDGDGRWSSIASLVNSFSRLALVSVVVVVVSGVIASWVHLAHLSALWQTLYGQILLLKLFLVGATLMIGAYNFRRVQPTLVSEVGTPRLKRSATLELGLGFLILLVTGFLTGISP
jgi:copper transport protein